MAEIEGIKLDLSSIKENIAKEVKKAFKLMSVLETFYMPSLLRTVPTFVESVTQKKVVEILQKQRINFSFTGSSTYPDIELTVGEKRIALDVKCFKASPGFDIGQVDEMINRWDDFDAHVDIVVWYSFEVLEDEQDYNIGINKIFLLHTHELIGKTNDHCSYQKKSGKIRPKSLGNLQSNSSYWTKENILDALKRTSRVWRERLRGEES